MKKNKKFHPSKNRAAEVIHPEDVPRWMSAWINPEGTIFHVEPYGHAYAAYKLGASVDELETEGWVHLTFGAVVMPYTRPTNPQMRSLHQIMRYVGKTTVPASYFAMRRSAELFGF